MRPTLVNTFGSTDTAREPGVGFALNGASQELVPAHPGRVALYVTAPAASVTLRLGTGSAVAGQGIVVAAGTTEKITGYSGAVQIIGTNLQSAGVVDL